MIDATGDSRHRNFLDELQRRKFAGSPLRRRNRSLCASHRKQTENTQSDHSQG
jgi:hypothetical protein